MIELLRILRGAYLQAIARGILAGDRPWFDQAYAVLSQHCGTCFHALRSHGQFNVIGLCDDCDQCGGAWPASLLERPASITSDEISPDGIRTEHTEAP